MSRGCFVAVVVAVLLLLSRAAGAENPCPDPGCHLKSESTLTTKKGSILELPPGYFLDEPTFAKRGTEMKAAQNEVTRLKAQNESFRKDAAKFSWAPVVGSAMTLIGSIVVYSLMK